MSHQRQTKKQWTGGEVLALVESLRLKYESGIDFGAVEGSLKTVETQEISAQQKVWQLWEQAVEAANEVIKSGPKEGQKIDRDGFTVGLEQFFKFAGAALVQSKSGELEILQKVLQDVELLKAAIVKVEQTGGVSKKNAIVAAYLAQGRTKKEIAETAFGGDRAEGVVAERVKKLRKTFGCGKKELIKLLRTAAEYNLLPELLVPRPEDAVKATSKAEPAPK